MAKSSANQKQVKEIQAAVKEASAELTEEVKVHFVKTESGYPVFFGSSLDHIRESAAKMACPIYFLVGSLEFKEEKAGPHSTSTPTVTYHKLPRVFKVVSNFAGEAIVELTSGEPLKLPTVKPQAKFGLPRIPLELVRKLEKFFRTVYQEKKAEAIVILTFDPKYTDSQGWGVLIPKQKNTAGSCKYEPESIVDEKDDDIIIVGTAHSHPEMSAYASHTDVGDQAEFDGLHITFGWKGSVTEFHIEMQMAGARFTFDPDVVFENLPAIPDFEELEAWVEKVDKPAHSAGYQSDYGWGVHGSGSTNAPTTYYDGPFGKFTIPNGCPNIEANTVLVSMLREHETGCPVCKNYLRKDEIDRRRCLRCMVFLALPGEDLDKVVEQRAIIPAPNDEIDIDRQPDKPIIWWHRVLDDNYQTKVSIKFLYSPSKSEKKVDAPEDLTSGANHYSSHRGTFTEWDDLQPFLVEGAIWCTRCTMITTLIGDGCNLCKDKRYIVLAPEIHDLNNVDDKVSVEIENAFYEIASEMSQRNICCEQPAEACRCDELDPGSSLDPMITEDNYFFGKGSTFNPYLEGGQCQWCIHFWSTSCPVLRQLTRQSVDDPYGLRLNYANKVSQCVFFLDMEVGVDYINQQNEVAKHKAKQRETERDLENLEIYGYQGYI